MDPYTCIVLCIAFGNTFKKSTYSASSVTKISLVQARIRN